ncbi:TetR/AcrR family transcriptional regulator [Ciceribacter thiooxidans]|uniref:TetR/AcrR family transcriptional regulator n=1 Tax=Ciceribacter thiooxidans TaxID=1969821 RepID=A0ABV7I0W6_9HYPH|nr:TetR/AcrR family transcriptional regulator [Ciceribacter thiooxidans]MDI6835622.1 TetR/AcrR family transcriptional regulator [Rhizobiaceae bacterium]
MTRNTSSDGEDGTMARGMARLVPTQKRSRERFERILECAAAVMAEKGSEAFRMSDIVERIGVPFGSLYQYFPDKAAIIGTLAVRYNAVGRECVRRDLSAMERPADMHAALCQIVDSYYRMFIDEPVMRDIWQATQADRMLQQIDEEDAAYLAGLLAQALLRVGPGAERSAVETFSQLVMTLVAAAVRHAITLAPDEAQRTLALFKRMLPKDVPATAS